jgi:hypothetical protein
MPQPRIVAMGGVPDETLLDHVLGLAPGKRLLYVPTAGMEDAARTVWWYERLHGRAEMTHLHFFPWPPSGLRSGSCRALDQRQQRRPIPKRTVSLRLPTRKTSGRQADGERR